MGNFETNKFDIGVVIAQVKQFCLPCECVIIDELLDGKYGEEILSKFYKLDKEEDVVDFLKKLIEKKLTVKTNLESKGVEILDGKNSMASKKTQKLLGELFDAIENVSQEELNKTKGI